MNKLILLIVSAVAIQAQTVVINGATARFRITASTSAPSSTACDTSNEVGSLHIRTGNQASVPTGVSVCKQTGASTYAWGPIGWYSQTTAPATCVVGELWFDTDATAGSNLNLCTASNTFTAVSAGAGTPAGSDTYVQYNSSGSFGAEAAFAYNASTNTLSVDKINLTGAASETIMTDISTPSAPSSGKTATYTKGGRWCTRANGGSEVCYADGNSSGEATKGVAGAYDATSWNGSSETPTKDAIRDKIESMSGGGSTLTTSFWEPFGQYEGGPYGAGGLTVYQFNPSAGGANYGLSIGVDTPSAREIHGMIFYVYAAAGASKGLKVQFRPPALTSTISNCVFTATSGGAVDINTTGWKNLPIDSGTCTVPAGVSMVVTSTDSTSLVFGAISDSRSSCEARSTYAAKYCGYASGVSSGSGGSVAIGSDISGLSWSFMNQSMPYILFY